MQKLLERVEKTTKSMCGVHYATTPEEVHRWHTSDIEKFYTVNKVLAEKGLQVERVFVLRKHSFIDPDTGQFDSESIRIIEDHAANLTGVYVVWEKNAKEYGLLIDIVLVDDEALFANEYPGNALLNWVPVESRDPTAISQYERKFQHLKKLGVEITHDLRGGKWVDSDSALITP